MSPDLKARRVLMSAHLYYDLGSPILSDSEFDALCFEVYEDWDQVSKFHQWQLGDPVELVSSAHHVYLTELTVDAAAAWHISETGHAPQAPYAFKAKGIHEGASYTTISG